VQFIQRIRGLNDVTQKMKTIKAIKDNESLSPSDQIEFVLHREVVQAALEDVSTVLGIVSFVLSYVLC
jgi:hypothetical protein